MGRLTILLLVFTLGFLNSAAQNYGNVDLKTAAQIEMNTAAIALAEDRHNQELDTIQKKQKKLFGLISVISTLNTRFQQTLENARGFEAESGIYKSIVARMSSIAKRTVSATDAIMNTNFNGKATSAFKIYELSVEAAHLGNVFFNIVCNGTVKNPHKLSGSNENTDKLNLLNRNERLNLALSILQQLNTINSKLLCIEYYCKHNSFELLLSHIDYKTYITLLYSKSQTKHLIDRWNGL